MVERGKLGAMQRIVLGIVALGIFSFHPIAAFAVNIDMIQADRERALQEAALEADRAASWEGSPDPEAKNQQQKHQRRFKSAMEQVREYDIQIANSEKGSGGRPTAQTIKERQAVKDYFKTQEEINTIRKAGSNAVIEPYLVEREISAMDRFAEENADIKNPPRPQKPDPFLERPYMPAKKIIGFDPNRKMVFPQEAGDSMLSSREKNLKPCNRADYSSNPDMQTTRPRPIRTMAEQIRLAEEFAKKASMISDQENKIKETGKTSRMMRLVSKGFTIITTALSMAHDAADITRNSEVTYAQARLLIPQLEAILADPKLIQDEEDALRRGDGSYSQKVKERDALITRLAFLRYAMEEIEKSGKISDGQSRGGLPLLMNPVY